jgi:predicted permease
VIAVAATIVVSLLVGVGAERRFAERAQAWARTVLTVTLYGLLLFVVFFNIAPIGAAVTLKVLVTPPLLLALTAPLVDLPRAFLLQAAMPSGINGLVIAHAYGLDLRTSAGAIAWSTAIVVVAATIGAVV